MTEIINRFLGTEWELFLILVAVIGAVLIFAGLVADRIEQWQQWDDSIDWEKDRDDD